MQCQAKAKSTGEQCRRRAVAGRTVCTVHGGLTPVGPALPQFKHGRYSKYLPTRMAERYQEAQADPDLLALRDEVALLDARLSVLLEQVDAGGTADVWKRLKDTFHELQRANASGDKIRQRALFFDLTQLIQSGGNEYDAWQEIYDMFERRRKLVESERKRLVEIQNVITVDRAMGLIAFITDTIRRHVSDRDALTAISTELRALLDRDAS